jgi:hypothetical protein
VVSSVSLNRLLIKSQLVCPRLQKSPWFLRGTVVTHSRKISNWWNGAPQIFRFRLHTLHDTFTSCGSTKNFSSQSCAWGHWLRSLASSGTIRNLTIKGSETNLPHMAAETLGSLGASPDLAVPALIACLQSPDQELRRSSVEALGDFDTNSLAAIPALIHCLQDRSSEVASEAAKTLGKIGLEPNLVIPALASALRSRSPDISAVMALGTFGTQATNELPLLTNLLSDPVWQVRFQASNAINCITANALTNAPTQ